MVAHHKVRLVGSVLRSISKGLLPIAAASGVIIAVGGAAVNGGERFEPHQYFSSKELRRTNDYDLTHYVAGMVDAMSYVTAANAIGEAVSKCLHEAKSTTVVFHEIYFQKALNAAPEGVPPAEIYMNVIRAFYAEYLK